MKIERLIESSRFVALIGIFSMLLLSLICFGWGALRGFDATMLIIRTVGRDPEIAAALISAVDVFLIATVLYVVAVSMYELFIGDLNLPEWMIAHNLFELKAKLSGVVILIMAIKFLEKVVEWKAPLDTLYFGIAIAFVSAALIALNATSKTKD